MKKKLDELVLDNDIYPRVNISPATIEWYVECLISGDIFPPLEVQRLVDGDGEKTVILDGFHRFQAFNEYNKKLKKKNMDAFLEEIDAEPISEVDCYYWKDEILNKRECLESLQIEATIKNLKHGKRLTKDDIINQATKIVLNRPIEKLSNITQELADTFHKPYQTMLGYIGEIVARRKITRDSKIFHLSLLDWTQDEIGDQFRLARNTISDIVGKLDFEKTDIIDDFDKKKKSIHEIAKFKDLDITTTWNIVLENKKDIDKFKYFAMKKHGGNKDYGNNSPKVYNHWNFPNKDIRLGMSYPGNIPGQIVMNLLYYYTEQGDLVVDPMAGGGSTIDACLVMGRKCRAYDISPPMGKDGAPLRIDIIQRDLITEGYDPKIKNTQLIFLDPPYWKQKKGDYSDDKTNLANLSLEEFHKALEHIFNISSNILRKDGYIAIIMGLTQIKTKLIDHPFSLYKFLEEKYTFTNRIIVPYSTQQYPAYQVSTAQKGKYMLNLYRDLLVFKKG